MSEENNVATVENIVAPEIQETNKKKKGVVFKIIAIILVAVLTLTNAGTALLLVKNRRQIETGYKVFGEGDLVSAKSGDKWGFIDKTGRFVINPEYDSVESFVEGLARVEKDEKYGYINLKGEVVINIMFDYAMSFYEGLAVVQSGELYGYIDKTGKYVINPQFDEAESFSEGIAKVEKDEKYGFIDKSGTYVINPQFDDAGYLSNGLIAVKSGNLWGYVDAKGQVIISYQFGKVSAMRDDGFAVVVTTDKKYIIIDKTGRQITSSTFDGIDGEAYTFCEEDDCYNNTYGDEYCYSHEEDDYDYCNAFGCLNKAVLGGYCLSHYYY